MGRIDRRNRLRCERGNLAIMMALMAPAFVGAVGLSIETGYWYYLQDKAQAAADVSAYAATMTLRGGGSNNEAQADGLSEAANLGYTSPVANVTVNVPPLSGPFTSEAAVEVIISYEAPRYFSSIFTNTTVTHSVRAVARTTSSEPACILALNPTASQALLMTGSTSLTLNGCELMSNSVASDSLLVSGSADVTAKCASAAGGATTSGGGHTLSLDCGSPNSSQPPAADPYASVPEPVATDYSCENFEDVATGTSSGKGKSKKVGAPWTVSPGSDGVVRFCGGLDLKDQVDFEPGIYIIDGGEFSMNATADVTGDDVTFFLTGGAEIKWNGNADFEFSAPTSGTYAGIAVMGDRGDTSADHKVNGSASSLLTGAIYTAGSAQEFLGNFSGVGGCMQIIADTIKISGNTTISQNCTPSGISWAERSGGITLVE